MTRHAAGCVVLLLSVVSSGCSGTIGDNVAAVSRADASAHAGAGGATQAGGASTETGGMGQGGDSVGAGGTDTGGASGDPTGGAGNSTGGATQGPGPDAAIPDSTVVSDGALPASNDPRDIVSTSVDGYRLMVTRKNSDGSLTAPAPYIMKGIGWSPSGPGEGQDHGSQMVEWADKDIPLMRAANINTVRTYGAPTVDDAGLAMLDKFHAQGIAVVMTVFSVYNDETYKDKVTKFKDHPAILMWMLGNEWNYNGLYQGKSYNDCATRINTVTTAIKAIDPNHAIATGHGELPSAAQATQVNGPDVWGFNVYSNTSFANRFTDWKTRSTKPMFYSEYGADAYNNKTGAEDQASQALALEKLTGEILKNLSASNAASVCLGGSPFEWNDEWWKGGDANAQGTSGFGGAIYPDGFANEEWWGIVDANRKPRQAYTSLQTLYR